MALTKKSDFLSIEDIVSKEITIPDSVPVWGGESLYITQLSRGQQDAYNQRVSGNMKMVQRGSKEQVISGMSLSGNDAWVCAMAIVNEEGKRVFKVADVDAINKKSGEAVGWISKQVIDFSGMADDDAKAVEAELEYYRTKYPDVASAYKKEYPPGLEGEVKN